MTAGKLISVSSRTVVVLDLDDTLYPELDFVRSGLRAVSDRLQPHAGEDPFEELWEMFRNGQPELFDNYLRQHGLAAPSVSELLEVYREHPPNLELPASSARLLKRLRERKIPLGLITDGRSVTQRNKLRALKIEDSFAEIVISEEIGSMKPASRNFEHFQDRFPGALFTYIGDNIRKDFVAPNTLGWQTIGLRDGGDNIHPQEIEVPEEYRPDFFVTSLDDLQLTEKKS